MARFAFQTELFGLTPAQRSTGAAQLNAALDGEAVDEVFTRDVRATFVLHGVTELFAQADFASDASGQRVFNAALTWASSRAVDAPDGRHSYVRVVDVNETTRLITTRYAESPAWTPDVTSRSLDAARPPGT